jgi:RNA polymerase sigma factor (sigma-70 family)
VRKIVVNANLNRFRKRRVIEDLTEAVPEVAHSGDAAGRHEDRAALIAALLQLPYGQRAVVVLRYWLDMTEAEVAAVMGCSVGNVKSQASRALAKLRDSAALIDGGAR